MERDSAAGDTPAAPSRTGAPDEIRDLAERRADCRRAGDWETADELRARIEGAGWRVVDRGLRFRLEPARPPTLREGDRVRYGSSAAVPSRLEEPATERVTLVLLADDPSDLERTLHGLRGHLADSVKVVIVAGAREHEVADALEVVVRQPVGRLLAEVVWTTLGLGHAGALNAGIRRASGEIIITLEAGLQPVDDFVTPLVAQLAESDVAIAGAGGLRSSDLRRFEPAPAGEVDAIDGACQAFRRSDYLGRGPLDEGFRLPWGLDAWWSLVLRDGGPDHPPRRAVSLDLPLLGIQEHDAERRQADAAERAGLAAAERDRQEKRNRYRIIERFGRRLDLLLEPSPPQSPRAAPCRGIRRPR